MLRMSVDLSVFSYFWSFCFIQLFVSIRWSFFFLAWLMNQQDKKSSMVKVSLKDIQRHDTIIIIIILCPLKSANRQSEIWRKTHFKIWKQTNMLAHILELRRNRRELHIPLPPGDETAYQEKQTGCLKQKKSEMILEKSYVINLS